MNNGRDAILATVQALYRQCALYLAAEGKQCGDFELQTAARRLVWEARQNMSLGLEEAIDEIENIVGCPDREDLI